MLELNIAYQRAHFSLHVQLHMQGQVLGILGDSGAGKSTLLSCISGLTQPDSGRIQLQQRLLFDSQEKINLPVYQRHIAMVFQDIRLFPHLRVAGNLSYGYDLLKPAQRKFAFDDIVDLLKLNDLLQRRPHQLSGGEAQRVALGRALLSSPDLLLLDEPLSSLDQHLKQQILPYFNQIKQQTGLAMLYVSHDEAEVHQISDQVVRLEQGRLIS